MKIIKQLSIAIILICLSAYNLTAFQGEPKDFRGIKWGTDISKVKHKMTILLTNGDYEAYIKKNDSMNIRSANLEEIRYGFKNGKFQSVSISFKGIDNYIAIKRVLFENYGSCGKEDWPWENCRWSGEKVNISISIINDKGSLIYFYKPLQQKEDGL